MPRSLVLIQKYKGRAEEALVRSGYKNQSEFAELAELSRGTVSKFFNSAKVSVENFMLICNLLNLDWNELSGFRDKGGSVHTIGYIPPLTKFYGRRSELESLSYWIAREKKNLVFIQGMPGIGKTSLCLNLIEELKDGFKKVIFVSLRSYPDITELLTKVVSVFADEDISQLPDEPLPLIEYLTNNYIANERNLLILDDIHLALQECQVDGSFRTECSSYEALIRSFYKGNHNSCLILTGSEAIQQIRYYQYENPNGVEFLQLRGLDFESAKLIFNGYFDSRISDQEQKCIVDHFQGNPLVLEQVRPYIEFNLGHNCNLFLKSIKNGELSFSGLNDVLDRQLNRLSQMEKTIIYLLALYREPKTIEEIRKDLEGQASRISIIEATNVSHNSRSLIEFDGSKYSLLPAIADYISEQIINESLDDILSGDMIFLDKFLLVRADSKEYIRLNQVKYLISPIISKLRNKFTHDDDIVQYLQSILESQKNRINSRTSKYAASNITVLLLHLKGNLSNLDLSSLFLSKLYLQGVELVNTDFSNSTLDDVLFTEVFSNILALNFNPEGDTIATGDGGNNIYLWDTNSGIKLRRISGHTDWVKCLVFTPDGKYIISGSGDKTIKVWDISSGNCIESLSAHLSRVNTVAVSPYGNIFASGSKDKTIKLWNLENFELIRNLNYHKGEVKCVIFSNEGEYIASCCDGNKIVIWDVCKEEKNRVIEGLHNGVSCLAFSYDDIYLASGSFDGFIEVWDLRIGERLTSIKAHSGRIRSLSFHPHTHFLASGGDDSVGKVWDLFNCKCLFSLKGHTHWIRDIEWSPSGKTILTGSPDQSFRLWNANDGKSYRVWKGYSNRIRSVRVNPLKSEIASTSSDNIIRIWDMKEGTYKAIKNQYTHWLQSIRYTPDGRKLVVGSGDKNAKLFSIMTGQCKRIFRGHHGRILQIDIDENSRLVTSGDDKLVKIWDIITGRCLCTMQGHSKKITCVTFSSSSTFIASGSSDGNVFIWNLDGEVYKKLMHKFESVKCLSFDSKDQILAVGTDSHTIHIWNIATSQEIAILRGHQGRVNALKFSSSSEILASSSQDGSIKIWDFKANKLLGSLEDHNDSVYSIDFCRNDDFIISGSDDESIKLWNYKSLQCISTFIVDRPYKGMNITGTYGLNQSQQESVKYLGANDYDD